jgi:hypothetical protein
MTANGFYRAYANMPDLAEGQLLQVSAQNLPVRTPKQSCQSNAFPTTNIHDTFQSWIMFHQLACPFPCADMADWLRHVFPEWSRVNENRV